MGHSSKKKKRGGGGRRSKGRTPSKDHNSQGGDGYDVISDEITALCAIFEEDCKVVSESPPQIYIKLRPYSKDTGYEDLEVSAFLSVRCLPGYPHKCPKLQIHPEKGLSKTDADNLLSLLHEQANSNARQGRVMIYNLVEVAQEFLSEIVPFGGLSNDSVPCQDTDRSCQLSPKDAVIYSNSRSTGPFVYGFLDLFSGSGESWNWGLEMEDNGGIKTSARSPIVAGPKDGYAIQRKDGSKQMPAAKIQDTMKSLLVSPAKLDIVDEVCEDEMKTISATDSDGFLMGEPDESDTSEDLKEVSIKELTEKADIDNSDSEFSEFAFPVSRASTHSPPTMEKDLILAHLLRLACTPKGQLADALPDITSELLSLGVISEEVRDLATKPSSLFEKTFQRAFGEQLALSRITQFWKTASDMQNTVSVPSSRYLSDFEELHPLGQGGFGHVVLCKNKLDGRQYAMKKIRLKDKSLPVNDRILREVATLSRLQHQHVVRYYQAWFETGPPGGDAGAIGDSMTAGSSSFSCMAASSTTDLDNKIESTYLYIQMEYCPRTLRQMFESYSHFDKELAWHLFRQIVEGLAHIHGQGIIHRDLTPNNIFFDARNDIKIGDFGLAKFLKLGQLEQDPDPAETAGVSIDGTGQVGTYFYTAPEIEQGWPKIDEKADMYSLGIVFFELWHPFGTAMERHIVLSDLKLKGEPPSSWATEYPDQASLLRHLMSPSPSDRPAATEVLKHSLPPRMENELLENLLRTMHTSEDTSVYDKVVNAIFDEDKDLGRNATSPIQLTDVDTEIRDQVVELTVEVFRQRCAKRLEVVPLRLLGDCPNPNMNAVKLLTRGGDKIELCHELRLPFVNWVTTNQKLYFKRYEVSYVYRRSIGHSPPNRYLQGDFDIIGGTSGLTEAEIIKTSMDIITSFFNSESCDIHVNHGNLLDAIWSWVGIKAEHRKNVSELLSLMGSLRPHESSERKSKWGVIRRQLRQELNLAEAVVNRLQIVGSRFCGPADQALPRLRGALPAVKSSREALDQLSELFTFLRFWRIEKRVFLDVLMPPTESYHRDMFFQIYLRKENNPSEGTLLAVGGRYDFLIDQMWRSRYKSNNPPGGVGVSIALETIIQNSSVDIKRVKYDTSTTSILVCSRGGGGYLGERMELVAELWEENIKADYVPLPDPSLTEQYEYANEHDIKCLVIITDTGVSKKGSVMVRYLEPKRVKEIERENLVKFLLEAMAVQFKNPSIWN